MTSRHTAARVLRPVLITAGIIAIAYLVGGSGFFTPSSFLGFMLVTIIVGVLLLLLFASIENDEHRHINAIAHIHAESSTRRTTHAHHDPPSAHDLWPVSAIPPGLPYGVGMRPDTPDKVYSFTRRVFRNRDMTHD